MCDQRNSGIIQSKALKKPRLVAGLSIILKVTVSKNLSDFIITSVICLPGNLADAIEIFRLAKEKNVPCFSSSFLRFAEGITGIRDRDDLGDILGCDAFSPCSLEDHHPDLYWYGIHGVEMLYTVMGTGCQTARKIQTKDCEFVVGVWKPTSPKSKAEHLSRLIR